MISLVCEIKTNKLNLEKQGFRVVTRGDGGWGKRRNVGINFQLEDKFWKSNVLNYDYS